LAVPTRHPEVMAVAAASRSCAGVLPGCGEFGPDARVRTSGETALVPPARQTGVVTGALAGAGEVGCAAGLVRQRIDGAAGQ
jgi:hypothetical protein